MTSGSSFPLAIKGQRFSSPSPGFEGNAPRNLKMFILTELLRLTAQELRSLLGMALKLFEIVSKA